MAGNTILIQSDTIGKGEEQLGLVLMANFLRLLGESYSKPETMIFWHKGVKLVCEGSPVLEHIRKLEKVGVTILACTTCLEYFDIKDKQRVGEPTTMLKSIQTMMSSEVISL